VPVVKIPLLHNTASVPLISPVLGEHEKLVYQLLGIKTVQVMTTLRAPVYTILQAHASLALSCLKLGQAHAMVRQECPTREIYLPIYTPVRHDIDLVEIYEALGITTAILLFEGVTYVVPELEIGQAEELLEKNTAAPRRAYPFTALYLYEKYDAQPSPSVMLLARLFNVPFLQVVNPATDARSWLPGRGEIVTSARKYGFTW
jgi:hypothetical protein